MDKSSKPSSKDRKERYAWRPTGVANVYMRAKKYYYAKMNRGKRHFVLLADSKLSDRISGSSRSYHNSSKYRHIEFEFRL
jgi:hypothetical protein